MNNTGKKKSINVNLFNFKKLDRGRMPTKKSINLAQVGLKKINLLIAIPAVTGIILAALLISKFAVIDRFAAVSKAQGEVAAMQKRVSAVYDKMNEYGDLNDLYYHYTYSNMTEEELTRSDRIKIMDMIKRDILSAAAIESWTVTGNKVTVVAVDESLSKITEIIKTLEEEELVNYCTVTTASTEDKEHPGNVKATIVIYMNTERLDIDK